jgi:hypothetical protein
MAHLAPTLLDTLQPAATATAATTITITTRVAAILLRHNNLFK